MAITQNRNQINITHNHQLLTEQSWQKEDQIKLQYMHALQIHRLFRLHYVIEFSIFNAIKLLYRSRVYNLEAYEYCNFISGSHIIHNSIEQDADLVLMLYKENEQHYRSKQILDIIVAKHRNGPIGAFQLLFYANICKFDNIDNQSTILTSY